MCPYCQAPAGRIVKYDFFSRLTGHQARIQRFHCRDCRRKFSSQTASLTYRERKPHLTQSVMRLLMEGMSSQRHARCDFAQEIREKNGSKTGSIEKAPQ